MSGDTPTLPPPPKQRGRRLKSLPHALAGLAHIIRELEAGRIDANRGNALINGFRVFAALLGADVDGKGVQVVIQREMAPAVVETVRATKTPQDGSEVSAPQPDAENAPAPVYGLPPGGAKA